MRQFINSQLLKLRQRRCLRKVKAPRPSYKGRPELAERIRIVKHTNMKKGCLIAIFTLMLAVLTGVSTITAGASSLTENGIDPDYKGSITITVNQDEWYVEGTIFRLYKVADLNGDFSFSYTDKFKNCGIDVANIQPVSLTGQLEATAQRWMDLSTSFIGVVRQQGISEDDARAIRDRKVTFSGLSLGLYLIQGDTAKEGNRTVTYQPVVICIPQRSSTYEPWKYAIESQVKSADPQYTPSSTPDNPDNPDHPTGTVTPTPTNPTTGTPTPTNPNPSGTGTPTPSNPGTTTPSGTGTPTPNGPGNDNHTTPTPTSPNGPSSNPKNPTSPAGRISRIFGVRTGDTAKIAIYGIIMLAAAAILIAALTARKKNSK